MVEIFFGIITRQAIRRGTFSWNVPDFIDTGLGCQFGEFPES